MPDIRDILISRSSVVVVLLVACLAGAAEARASTPSFAAVGRATAPLTALPGLPAAQQEQEQERPTPPPVPDPEAGAVLSILAGSVWSGSSTFQVGGAFAYFFGGKGTVGFEVEGDFIRGPGGNVVQVMGSLMIQFGARTSKFVPYAAGGVGYLRANSSFPDQTLAVLEELGIRPEPEEEQAPFFQFGGGLRFYVRSNLAFRGDIRFAQGGARPARPELLRQPLSDASRDGGDQLGFLSRAA